MNLRQFQPYFAWHAFKVWTSGSGPSNSLAVDGNANRVIGATYDAAGYQLSGPNGGTLSYDGYGRMTFASVGGHSVTEEFSAAGAGFGEGSVVERDGADLSRY